MKLLIFDSIMLMDVKCCPFIMLYLGSIRRDHVLSELCYKGTILQRNYTRVVNLGTTTKLC